MWVLIRSALLMTTHNICFCREIRKLFAWYPLLSRHMAWLKSYSFSHPGICSPLIHLYILQCLMILSADSSPHLTTRTCRQTWAFAVRICPNTHFCTVILKRQEKLHLKMSSVYVVCWIFLQTYFCIQANSVDPDQTAPKEAVWSGSTLFAKMTFKITSRWQSRRQ